jgi:hypothetical protein
MEKATVQNKFPCRLMTRNEGDWDKNGFMWNWFMSFYLTPLQRRSLVNEGRYSSDRGRSDTTDFFQLWATTGKLARRPTRPS